MKLAKIGTKSGEYDLVEIGESFGPMKYIVDDHAIKTYAFVQDDYHPWYFSKDTPFGDRIAHASLLANELLGAFLEHYDPSKIVGLHTQEELWFYNPVFAGEEVVVKGEYVDKYERRGKGYVVMEADAVGADGRPIIKHRGIEIMRIEGRSLAGKKTATVSGDMVTGEYDETIMYASQASEKLKPGTPLAPLVKQTTPEQTQIYSRAGQYFENIHNNIHVAQNAGYPDLVVQGQQQVGYIVEMLTNFFGKNWFTSGYVKLKMVKPVFVGEKLTFSGVVRSMTMEAGHKRLNLHVWGRDSKGDMTILGWASCNLSD